MIKNMFLILVTYLSLLSCANDEIAINNKMLPIITTSSASNISSSSATVGGNILSNGNDNIVAFGICWSSTPEPTLDNLHSIDSEFKETFIYSIQGLTKNHTYYVRAHATNSLGTSYGNQITLTTDEFEHVYVSGISDGRSVYWKDGELIPLTPSGTFNYAIGSAITVSNNDVFVAGYEHSSGTDYQAKYWKNGMGTTVGSLQSFAKAITVVNDDVYVVGTENTGGSSYAAKVWKNGIGTTLSTPGASGKPSSVFVVNSNVYVGGTEDSGVDRKGMIWMNGSATRLYGLCFPNANASCTFDWTNINDIFVANNDVYAVGTSISDSGIDDNIMWKNGIATQINIKPSSIFIKNNDIYIAGTVGNFATIWKNGTITLLTNGSNQAFANSVYILGDDVYVVGSERIPGSPNTIAKLWKNGTEFNLSDGALSAEATDIFVQ